jgi:Uma2 family endonuclease
MSATIPPTAQASLATTATFRRFTVAEYHRLIRADFFTTDDRVELIDGYLVNKMPQNDPHASTVQRLTEDLVRLAPQGWRVRIQLPITLATSEPEPDGAVVRGDRRSFDHRQPGRDDFGVVVEVADSPLAFDRGPKAALYAAAGIPVYWVVNVADGQVEVYTGPDTAVSPPAYGSRIDYHPGQNVPLVLDGQTVAHIPAADLLP